MKVVARSAPFQRTTDPLTKWEPITFKAKPPLPASTWFGCTTLITGAGLVMLKVDPLEVPPGLETVTCAEPTIAMSAAEIVADNWVVEMTFVGLSELFQRTTEPLPKFSP